MCMHVRHLVAHVLRIFQEISPLNAMLSCLFVVMSFFASQIIPPKRQRSMPYPKHPWQEC
jgi:hypothetical protein